MTPLTPEVITVVGGYHVVLKGRLHIVDKKRRCSCGWLNCSAVRAVAAYLRAGGQRAPEHTAEVSPSTFPCPICQSPARGTLVKKNWMCSVDRSHFFLWRVQRIRQARAQAMQSASPYTLEVLTAFASNEARAAFRTAHPLTYPAGA